MKSHDGMGAIPTCYRAIFVAPGPAVAFPNRGIIIVGNDEAFFFPLALLGFLFWLRICGEVIFGKIIGKRHGEKEDSTRDGMVYCKRTVPFTLMISILDKG